MYDLVRIEVATWHKLGKRTNHSFEICQTILQDPKITQAMREKRLQWLLNRLDSTIHIELWYYHTLRTTWQSGQEKYYLFIWNMPVCSNIAGAKDIWSSARKATARTPPIVIYFFLNHSNTYSILFPYSSMLLWWLKSIWHIMMCFAPY